MIKLDRPQKPAYLTHAKVTELTAKFKADGSSVWRKPEITDPLIKASHKKCAYCECKLQEKDSYMEVEHFRHKDKYNDDVVKWENLVPSCKRCNGKKGTHDVVIEPIVEPFNMDPSDHLYLQMVYFRDHDDVGKATIETLDLNNYKRMVLPRFYITGQIERNIFAIEQALEAYTNTPSVRRKNGLIRILTDTLLECQPNSEFAATAATFLHLNPSYATLCAAMKAGNLWDEELEKLHQLSEAIRLV
ncbi:HNH endonuclease [Pacificibacter marinus]|uniref:HNH endonuclease n=1 Tax=Pacificibacter marinus TaxID=658057 RepID=A0A1Y5TTJ0_9RHOB|nr:HNH endonuclease [Pacificibacter marinus]SEL43245.1 TIGR02646 family protein [Pacificibacter marinus]SLN71269.1 HNH endonuclease [Pacificibacter marinus]